MKGESKIKHFGFRLEARYVAGPLPKDLPNNTIFYSGIPTFSSKKL